MAYFYNMETGDYVSMETIRANYRKNGGTKSFSSRDFIQFVNDSYIEDKPENARYIDSLLEFSGFMASGEHDFY